MFRRYQVKLYPNDFVRGQFETWERHCRFLWNLCLEQRLNAWPKKKYPSYYDQQRELTELKHECRWLYQTPAHMLQAVIGDLDAASKRMFKRKNRRPRFKKRNFCSSSGGMYVPCNDGALQNGFLRICKVGFVRFRGLKKVPGKLKSFNLKKIAGDWFASLLFEIDEKKNENESIVGIDRGITSLITLSDGTLIDNPRWYRTTEKKLKKEQRALSRKKKGSSRRKKQQLCLARAHRKVRNVRNDFLHKLSTEIAKNHGIVVMEDLRIGNMVKLSKGMAKSILDAGWGTLQRMLSYKCREVSLVNPAYTSQTCSECKHVSAENRNRKEFVCVECGHRDDADVNAAKNIKASALSALSQTLGRRVRGEDVLTSSMKREDPKGIETLPVPVASQVV